MEKISEEEDIGRINFSGTREEDLTLNSVKR